MNQRQKKVRALGLCSGGLDSILSALVLRRQGIEVAWVAFETPFFSASKARRAARLQDIPLRVEPITAVYMEMLRNPPCGYGRYMNPCLDCHALMFRLAGHIMQEQGFDFLFSGEVLGQRPMSQTSNSLRYVEKHSGWKGRILRPLSARALPPTQMEARGWVDREKLLRIQGRGRKAQIQLAREFGVVDYPAPAGGCLLTDKGYTRRLRDLFKYQAHCTDSDLHLLKYGRHFRLDDQTKLVVGRTQGDNENILRYCDPKRDIILKTQNIPGPVGVIPNGCEEKTVNLAAAIIAGYSKAPEGRAVEVDVETVDGHRLIYAAGLPRSEAKPFML